MTASPITTLRLSMCLCLLIFSATSCRDAAEELPPNAVDTNAAADATSPQDVQRGKDTAAQSDVSDVTQGVDSGWTYAYQPPDPSICDDSLALGAGTLCALRPSRLDSAARDQFGAGNAGDKNLGFGYHVVAFPKGDASIRGVYVHFTGSLGRPYRPGSKTFPSQTLLEEAMGAGYIIVQVAYHNRFPVNSKQECGGATDVDNCAGLVRLEKITGEDKTNVVDVPLADSITQRFRKVVSYLEGQGFTFPVVMVSDGEVAWQNLRVGGHSQGAGHALYVTKYWDSLHTCLFGGPYDVPDKIPALPQEGVADWFLDASQSVDLNKVRALVAEDDANYGDFLKVFKLLGFKEGVHWRSFSAASYKDRAGETVDGHTAVVKDPAFKQQRAITCFSPEAD